MQLNKTNQLFCAQEAILIKSMPRFSELDEDKITWWRSRFGNYSVRSAYYALMDGVIDNLDTQLNGAWMSICKAGVPPKVKLLLWRLARRCLPTRSNLIKRYVECPSVCPICERGDETGCHAFFDCSAVSASLRSAACILSLVSPSLRSAADSDLVWKTFLPSDHKDIVSRAINPSTLNFSSYKQLFHLLCHPILLDAGNKSFQLEKSSGKKCYILSARELSIAWSTDPIMWCWKPTPESRFADVAELRTVNLLEIEGKIRTRILTPNTLYAAYLVMNVSQRGYGLDYTPSEVSIVMGNKVKKGKAYLGQKDENKVKMETLFYGNRRNKMGQNQEEDEGIQRPCKREDGWMEIEIGEFFSGEEGYDEEIKMSLIELGYQLKGGLIIEGIEVRPKQIV